MRYAHLRNLVKASSPSVNRFVRAGLKHHLILARLVNPYR